MGLDELLRVMTDDVFAEEHHQDQVRCCCEAHFVNGTPALLYMLQAAASVYHFLLE